MAARGDFPDTKPERRSTARGLRRFRGQMTRLSMLKPRVPVLMQPRPVMVEPPRIRGRQLQAIRARVLSAKPLCAMCEARGLATAATQVDHVVALGLGGSDDPADDSNRQALCDDCHSAKTKADIEMMR
jgi:5-methylcytosine-specific restriction protein A